MNMSAIESNETTNGAALRIEAVDNWHDQWKPVLAHVAAHGTRKKLRVDDDGWLSARQVLLVAFVGKRPAAHVCFDVSPATDGCIAAQLQSYGVDRKFCGRGIESQLHKEAQDRARALGCEKLKGFKLNSKWC